MDDSGDIGGGNSEQCTGASCNDVKDSGTDDCHIKPSDDAELDDLLEGTLMGMKLASRACRSAGPVDSVLVLGGATSQLVTRSTRHSPKSYDELTGG